MDEKTFHARLNDLLEKIRQLPGESAKAGEALAQQSCERRERLRASLAELQESLDYLRLSVKYLVFDLEATRRENDYLRRLIEQANRPESPADNENDEDGENFLEGPSGGD